MNPFFLFSFFLAFVACNEQLIFSMDGFTASEESFPVNPLFEDFELLTSKLVIDKSFANQSLNSEAISYLSELELPSEWKHEFTIRMQYPQLYSLVQKHHDAIQKRMNEISILVKDRSTDLCNPEYLDGNFLNLSHAYETLLDEIQALYSKEDRKMSLLSSILPAKAREQLLAYPRPRGNICEKQDNLAMFAPVLDSIVLPAAFEPLMKVKIDQLIVSMRTMRDSMLLSAGKLGDENIFHLLCCLADCLDSRDSDVSSSFRAFIVVSRAFDCVARLVVSGKGALDRLEMAIDLVSYLGTFDVFQMRQIVKDLRRVKSK